MSAVRPKRVLASGPTPAPTDLADDDAALIASALRQLLADVFTLYFKTKNFHWHMSGPHFRDYHLLLDEHANQLLGMTDDVAERARKIGADTLRSVGDLTRHRRLADDDRPDPSPTDMLVELADDNRMLVRYLRSTHDACDDAKDYATAGMIENWIDQAERRAWFLTATLQTH